MVITIQKENSITKELIISNSTQIRYPHMNQSLKVRKSLVEHLLQEPNQCK